MARPENRMLEKQKVFGTPRGLCPRWRWGSKSRTDFETKIRKGTWMAFSYSKLKNEVSDHILGQVLDARARQRENLKDIPWKIAVASGKGGVGKSALTASLALALSRLGASVAVLDADLNGPSQGAMLRPDTPASKNTEGRFTPGLRGNLAVMGMDVFIPGQESPLRWENAGGLAEDSYVWRGLTEARAVESLLTDTDWGQRDMLLIDLPPGTHRMEEFLRILPDLDALLLVGVPSPVAGQVVARSITLCNRLGFPLMGLVENMSAVVCEQCGHENSLFPGQEGLQALSARHNVSFLGRVPFDKGFCELLDTGRDPFENPGPAATALLALATEVNNVLLKRRIAP